MICKRHRAAKPAFQFRLSHLAALTILAPTIGWATCVDSPTNVYADGGSICTATGASYTTTGNTLYAAGSGSQLTFPNPVTGTSSNSSISGRAVFTAYDDADMIFEGASNTIDLRFGNNSYGLAAGGANVVGTGRITVDGDLTINMQSGGNTRRGVLSLSTGGEVLLKGHTVITASGGNNQRGLSAEGGLIDFNTADIDFTGYPISYGIRNTLPVGGSVVGRGHIGIVVDGAGSWAIYATSGSVSLSSATLAAGTGGAGAIFTNGQSVAITGAAALSTASSNTAAVAIGSSGSVSLGANARIDATDPTGIGVLLTDTGNAFSAGDGLMLTAGGSAFQYSSSTGTTIALTNASVTAALLWNADAASATIFEASGGVYTGASSAASGGNLDVTLDDAAVWNLGANSTMTALTLSNDARLDASGGNYTLAADNITSNGGVLDLRGVAAPVAGQQLTLGSNYSAANGAVRLDTVLGDSASATDLLVIDGDTSGTTVLNIANVGGTGAATTGDGILVVRVLGASLGDFTLGGSVQAGNYRYTLHKVNKDWYLQSQFSNAAATSVPVRSPLALVFAALGALALGLFTLLRRQ